MDYTVHGILQARIRECVAFPFSRGSSQPRDRTQGSCIAGGFFTSWATREAQECEWAAYPFSRRTPRPRNPTGFSCIAGGFFSNWAIREAGRVQKLAFMGQREPGKWPEEERQRGKRKTRQGWWASANSWQNSSTEKEYFYNLKCLKEAGAAQMFSLNLTMGRFCVLMKTVISTDFRNREPVWEVSWSWDTEVSE